jgi:Protein of unknown function (DUF3105)
VSQSTRRPDAAGKGPGRPVPSTGGGTTPPTRTGRRERAARPSLRERSFFERNRSRLVAVVAGAVLLSAAAFVVIGATSKAYGCTTLSTPAPAESVGPSETPLLGQAQPDMGRSHIVPGTVQTYTYCPPASGFHVNSAGLGPIQPRFYGPDDATEPEGWIHNMEHAGLVVLYSCAGGCPDDATLQKLQDFANPATFPTSPICKIPAGVVGPVVARFDDMKTKFAAMVWDRIFLMDTFDPAQVLTFYQQFGDTTEPEPQVQCTQVSPSPSAEPSANPSASSSAAPSGGSAVPSGSAAPSGSGSPAAPATSPAAPTTSPSASPSLSPGPS